MYLTLKKRLDYLIKTKAQIEAGQIVFDPDKSQFGFEKFKQLFPVSENEIKGYPCMMSHKFSDPVKFGIKIIPLELKYEKENHPCRIEIALLKEFTKNVVETFESPHITFFFAELSVPNRSSALSKFPLKDLRREIHRQSSILISEYVPGGSIEEWIQEQPNIPEKQWKYVVFSIVWSLIVLHDKYQFLHTDFHYGNILIDTSIDPIDKSYYQYKLQDGDDSFEFNIQNPGIFPKMWDFEFASTYCGGEHGYINEFFKGNEENVPHEFNPYYDCQYFLTSLLSLNIPERLRNFIYDIYPEEVLPPIPTYSSGFSALSAESERTSSISSGSSSSRSSDSSTNSTVSEEPKAFGGYDPELDIKTPYMLGDRMLNGTEKKLKLPTPLDILKHEYFSDYRKPLNKRTAAGKKGPALTFSYKTKEKVPVTEESLCKACGNKVHSKQNAVNEVQNNLLQEL